MDKFLSYVTEYLSNIDIINLVLVGTIVFLSIIIFMMFITFVLKKKDPTETLSEINKKISTKEINKESFDENLFAPIKQKPTKKGDATSPTQEETSPCVLSGSELLDIDRIYNDMLIGPKDSSICSMVIQCKGINFPLMSNQEKFEIEKTFANFMNTLKFPIQIYIQTRTLQYANNADIWDEKKQDYEHELKELVDKLNGMEISGDAPRNELNRLLVKIKSKQKIYDYFRMLHDQILFTRKSNVILQNDYYIVLNYFNIEPEAQKTDTKNDKILNNIKESLTDKAKYLIEGVKRCGVEAHILNSKQLVELVCSSFLCEQDYLYKVEDMIDSGILKLQ